MGRIRSKYKIGDVLITKAGSKFTVVGFEECPCTTKCGKHYILKGHRMGPSHSVQRIDALDIIIPPTPAGQVLFGHS